MGAIDHLVLAMGISLSRLNGRDAVALRRRALPFPFRSQKWRGQRHPPGKPDGRCGDPPGVDPDPTKHKPLSGPYHRACDGSGSEGDRQSVYASDPSRRDTGYRKSDEPRRRPK